MADKGFKVEKIVLNKGEIRNLLQSDEMMAAIKDVASGEGEIVKEYVGFDRVHAVVKEEK